MRIDILFNRRGLRKFVNSQRYILTGSFIRSVESIKDVQIERFNFKAIFSLVGTISYWVFSDQSNSTFLHERIVLHYVSLSFHSY